MANSKLQQTHLGRAIPQAKPAVNLGISGASSRLVEIGAYCCRVLDADMAPADKRLAGRARAARLQRPMGGLSIADPDRVIDSIQPRGLARRGVGPRRDHQLLQLFDITLHRVDRSAGVRGSAAGALNGCAARSRVIHNSQFTFMFSLA